MGAVVASETIQQTLERIVHDGADVPVPKAAEQGGETREAAPDAQPATTIQAPAENAKMQEDANMQVPAEKPEEILSY